MSFTNLFIGGLPVLIFLYHLAALPFEFMKNLKHLLKISSCFLFSRTLKSMFKKQRNYVLKNDIFYRIRVIMSICGSKYAFPSGHTLFFTSYFFDKYTVFEMILVGLLSYSRVYYGHHTLEDVVFAVVFGSIFNFLYDYCIMKLSKLLDRRKLKKTV
ncbi:hypothetical protein EDEG_00476 [Edhazardia aedis USNM 41457]|uniref:Phosphatidic acid phosphatase type 2/haloperoxidase domain-containing protein n=1 Tax=Edhazardia aedis (strain USNM 41457) TaxID=1003232 RepID=J9D0E4_EDHAE|nr:hypothetical protein EDEG_00476 [Edhazardia aedis USNM 41457]|eukprot:EJW01351.1 hypothetical protein EDEG_00476 [Edhazardia aedis USNM 41457]